MTPDGVYIIDELELCLRWGGGVNKLYKNLYF